jgi:hypothetical protein
MFKNQHLQTVENEIEIKKETLLLYLHDIFLPLRYKSLFMSELTYSYNEFLGLLLIYVAHVDMEFSPEEEKLIKQKIGNQAMEKVLKDFEGMSDFQAFQTILSYKGAYFPTTEQKEEILENMKKLFLADDDFSTLEKETYHFLEKML